jgi:hypothetical protein
MQFLFLSLLSFTYAVPAMKFAATTTWKFEGNTLPTGLVKSTGTVEGAEGLLDHRFDKKNVYVEGGYLNLLVPGGQEGKQVISTAEVATAFSTLYGSVRVEAILTEVAGVCNGMSRKSSIFPSPKLVLQAYSSMLATVKKPTSNGLAILIRIRT